MLSAAIPYLPVCECVYVCEWVCVSFFSSATPVTVQQVCLSLCPSLSPTLPILLSRLASSLLSRYTPVGSSPLFHLFPPHTSQLLFRSSPGASFIFFLFSLHLTFSLSVSPFYPPSLSLSLSLSSLSLSSLFASLTQPSCY